MDHQLKEDQRRFALLGLYDQDKIDGLYGLRTQAAIDAFCEHEQISDETDVYRRQLWEKIKAIRPNEYYEAESLLPELIRVAYALYLTMPEQVGYMMATVEHETAGQFYPVPEAFNVSERARERYLSSKPYGKGNPAYYGRGLVQLTWESNYRKYQTITGAPLLSDPDLLLEPRLSLLILVHGMKTGTFTGVGLERYINQWRLDYVNARRVVNGTDKAEHISRLSEKWTDRARDVMRPKASEQQTMDAREYNNG